MAKSLCFEALPLIIINSNSTKPSIQNAMTYYGGFNTETGVQAVVNNAQKLPSRIPSTAAETSTGLGFRAWGLGFRV